MAPAGAVAAAGRRETITGRALDAALQVLVDGGWGQMTPKAVARAAGVSQRAVQSRFATRSDIAVALWVERLGPQLQERLADLLAAGGQLGPEPRPADFIRSFTGLVYPDPELVAALELVMVSPFDPALRQGVRSTLGDEMVRWCTPARGSVSAALAARRAYLLAIGLGLVAASPTAPKGLRLDDEAARVLAALAEGRRPVALPRVEAAHMRERPLLAPDDPALQALLAATLDEVGERGFDGATTAGIARRAGYSEGLVFSRYRSKLDLFLDACEIQVRPGYEANEAYLATLTESHGRGVAEAALIREFMHPDAEGPRTLNLEQVRVSWHEAHLRERMSQQAEDFIATLAASPGFVPEGRDPAAYFHLGNAIGLGIVLLPRLYPDAWRLPFDVMTIPLEDG